VQIELQTIKRQAVLSWNFVYLSDRRNSSRSLKIAGSELNFLVSSTAATRD
jgi:hypothetical protein